MIEEKIKKFLISALIGAMIGSLATFAVSYELAYLQDNHEKSEIANGFLTEIMAYNNTLNDFNNISQNDIANEESVYYPENNTVFIYQYHYIFEYPFPLIPKPTMYDTFGKDTFRFNMGLSSDLYIFYTNLRTADDARQQILDLEERSQNGDQIPGKNNTELFLSTQFKQSLNQSVNMIPKIKNELIDEIVHDDTSFIPI